ncbi:glucosamine-6-phosphate n-acetyltransferase [Stylonychia lemnae]|uniref:Glucosamine 6-phosphate N-acetyltransferase n=1 Tax=Stylonychia lemnae TaxID=5949 RepID=A0A078B6P3_STYLE|nr:glucosamine-6-phosphate n-acetyltransferase [Stylonychia lemnae]|eukprot:CDW88957.1 glucosamine-6-phosphate n-acetyltransferase [Stylonychia lemnae]
MESNKCAIVNLDYNDVAKKEQEILSKESDEDFSFRFVQRDDFKRGHLQTLAQLTVVGNVTQQEYEKRWDELFPQHADHYRIVVIVDKRKDMIVGSGTLFIEKKFIRESGILQIQPTEGKNQELD